MEFHCLPAAPCHFISGPLAPEALISSANRSAKRQSTVWGCSGLSMDILDVRSMAQYRILAPTTLVKASPLTRSVLDASASASQHARPADTSDTLLSELGCKLTSIWAPSMRGQARDVLHAQ